MQDRSGLEGHTHNVKLKTIGNELKKDPLGRWAGRARSLSNSSSTRDNPTREIDWVRFMTGGQMPCRTLANQSQMTS